MRAMRRFLRACSLVAFASLAILLALAPSAHAEEAENPAVVKVAFNDGQFFVHNSYRYGHTKYALKEDGTLWAWGSNFMGQIGDGTTVDRKSPVKIMDEVSDVSVFYGYAFALKRDGSLWSWGDYDTSIINNGDLITTLHERRSPIKYMDGVNELAYNSKYSDSYASWSGYIIKKDDTLGRLSFVSDNPSKVSYVQLMDHVKHFCRSVVATAGMGPISHETFFVIKDDGSLWGWGSYRCGELGEQKKPNDGKDRYKSIDVKSAVKIMDGVTSVFADTGYVAAIKNDGSLWTWGRDTNQRGEYSYSDTWYPDQDADASYSIPRKVADGVVEEIAPLTYLKNDGSFWVWAPNGHKQGKPKKIIDDVRHALYYSFPTYVYGTDGSVVDNLSRYSAGAVIKKDGSLWKWELDLGELEGKVDPYNDLINPVAPVPLLKSLTKMMDGVANYDNSEQAYYNQTERRHFYSDNDDVASVIKTDGSLWIKGPNEDGQIGDGTTTDRADFVKVFDAARYGVKFDAAGGSAVKSAVVTRGEQLAKPADPSRAGFVFKGWYTDKALTKAYDFNAAVEAGMTLYAKWEKIPVTYMVTFDSNGGPAVAAQEVVDGEKATEPKAPVREGYAFKGWFADKALTKAFDFSASVKANVILFAKWEKSVVPTPVPKPESTGYSDVAVNNWVYTQGWLQYVTVNKIMGGYRGRFAPEDPLTRGQVAAVLYRIANPGSDATTNQAHYGSDTGFKDGGSQRYYYAAVKWMKEAGISTGDRDAAGNDLGTFRPDDKITRQELAAFVYRFAGKMGVESGAVDESKLLQFKDGGTVQPYAREAMAWCNAEGIITGGQGSAAGFIGPGQEATRAQAAKIFTVTKRDVLKK